MNSNFITGKQSLFSFSYRYDVKLLLFFKKHFLVYNVSTVIWNGKSVCILNQRVAKMFKFYAKRRNQIKKLNGQATNENLYTYVGLPNHRIASSCDRTLKRNNETSISPNAYTCTFFSASAITLRIDFVMYSPIHLINNDFNIYSHAC